MGYYNPFFFLIRTTVSFGNFSVWPRISYRKMLDLKLCLVTTRKLCLSNLTHYDDVTGGSRHPMSVRCDKVSTNLEGNFAFHCCRGHCHCRFSLLGAHFARAHVQGAFPDHKNGRTECVQIWYVVRDRLEGWLARCSCGFILNVRRCG